VILPHEATDGVIPGARKSPDESGLFSSPALPQLSPHPAIVACTGVKQPWLTVQAAEQPDQQDDRQRNPDEPKQQTASHDRLQLRYVVP
jgi:hypothetical protein